MKGDRVRGKHPSGPIRLVALLGNHGQQYARTRHNVAWMLAPYLCETPQSQWKEKFHGVFTKAGDRILLMPYTYMNRSGTSVQAAGAFFGVEPAAIAVVHDDMETPFGSVEAAWAGGHRGHNGVRSTIQQLGTGEFWRIRLGIGRPPANRRPADWVLERFSPDEEAWLDDLFLGTASYLAAWWDTPVPSRQPILTAQHFSE